MSIYDRLENHVQHVDLVPEQTSYFATPENHLDPLLFVDDHVRPSVRSRVLGSLYSFWAGRYRDAHAWSRVWLAGSGVSYLWSAARDPGDLDVLVGVNFPDFRRANTDFQGLSDVEIADYLNDDLRDNLWPTTSNFLGAYEATFYVNPRGWDITTMKPYAAYNLTTDAWTVHPDPHPHPPLAPEYLVVATQDAAHAQQIVDRYDKALEQMIGVSNPGMRLNAEITVRATAREGADLFDQIHSGRKNAFGPDGMGYADMAEYRYKSAKQSGALEALRHLKGYLTDSEADEEEHLYGRGISQGERALLASALSRRYSQ